MDHHGAVSYTMITDAANRSRDTRPELALRSAAHALGLRYRMCTRPLGELRITADLVFRTARVAVFVDGCFWHGCPDHGRQVGTKTAFWDAKIARNQRRDGEANNALQAAGWVAVRVWEHESADEAALKIARIVNHRRRATQRDGRPSESVRETAGNSCEHSGP